METLTYITRVKTGEDQRHYEHYVFSPDLKIKKMISLQQFEEEIKKLRSDERLPKEISTPILKVSYRRLLQFRSIYDEPDFINKMYLGMKIASQPGMDDNSFVIQINSESVIESPNKRKIWTTLISTF